MKQGMRQIVSQSLEQKLSLYQVMLTSEVLSMPPGALDTLLIGMASNPELSEKIINNPSEDLNNSDSELKSFYTDFVRNKREFEGGDHSGIISTFKPEDFASIFGKEAEIKRIPDVTYIGRENEKPIMEFAPHISSKKEISFLMIPSKFEKTASLFKSLVRSRDWMTETFREMYVAVGEKQREFLYTLAFRDMNIFSLSDVAEKLDLHKSNICRLRKDRLVRIGERGCVVKSDLLMPTKDDLLRYRIHALLNRSFEEEVMNGEAMSDNEISRKINHVRRTIAKYRIQEGIPDIKGRQQEYRSGRKEAYHIPETLLE